MNCKKRLTVSLTALVAFCAMLGVTCFALGMTVIRIDGNTFETGLIAIDLNGGKSVFEPGEGGLEPGATLERPFYIKNNGSGDVYYKLYFSSISGSLSEALEVTVLDLSGRVLLEGRLCDLTRRNVPAVKDTLAAGERRELRVRLHLPSGCGSEYGGSEVSFELAALAVQTKNNGGKEFE